MLCLKIELISIMSNVDKGYLHIYIIESKKRFQRLRRNFLNSKSSSNRYFCTVLPYYCQMVPAKIIFKRADTSGS